jgi:dihydroneopterin aldolase
VTRIGVPAEERKSPQSVEAFLQMSPSRGHLRDLDDAIESTIDYYRVSERVRQLAASGERQLIETLAEEIADLLLTDFPVRAVTVEIRKFILPDTQHVAVTLSKAILA